MPRVDSCKFWSVLHYDGQNDMPGKPFKKPLDIGGHPGFKFR